MSLAIKVNKEYGFLGNVRTKTNADILTTKIKKIYFN